MRTTALPFPALLPVLRRDLLFCSICFTDEGRAAVSSTSPCPDSPTSCSFSLLREFLEFPASAGVHSPRARAPHVSQHHLCAGSISARALTPQTGIKPFKFMEVLLFSAVISEPSYPDLIALIIPQLLPDTRVIIV